MQACTATAVPAESISSSTATTPTPVKQIQLNNESAPNSSSNCLSQQASTTASAAVNATANSNMPAPATDRQSVPKNTSATHDHRTPSPLKSTPPLQPDYQQLLDHCAREALYFCDDHTEKGQRLYAALMAWQDFIRLSNKLVLQVNSFAAQYDFDADTPGNGYRSFVTVTNACIQYGMGICKNLTSARQKMFFRKKSYMKEVEACSQLLSSLCTCLQYLLVLHDWSAGTGDLFALGQHSAEELFEMGDTINQYCFYGRCLGFQYGDSIRGVLRLIAIGMASFSESFYAGDADGSIAKTTRSIWSGGKYFLNPELRARRIVNISQNARIDFCKSFWFLAESELMHKIPSIVGSSIKVNRVIAIPAEPLKLPSLTNASTDVNQNSASAESDYVDIPVPSAHLGLGNSVTARLLSYTRREGMLGEGQSLGSSSAYRGWRKLAPRSRSLLFHCHGGGFVAQSSKSHELYLRDWAVALDVPILSIDYSLAPEAPYPRALEEGFYAYCWMLKNSEHLGSTAERIVLAGDSAGANLCISIALKCIEMGVRVPDGLFLAYCPTLISFVPSPARLLCLMDPLLPFGFLMRCLRAYAAPAAENTQQLAELMDMRPVLEREISVKLQPDGSANSSRRPSAGRSTVSSLADNSNWEQIKVANGVLHHSDNESLDESGSDTFASASYHSENVEGTDLISAQGDNSSCVSLEDDSQPIEHYPVDLSKNALKNDSEIYINNFLDKYLTDSTTSETKESVKHAASEENMLMEMGKEMIAFDSLHGRFNDAVNSISTTINKYTQSSEIHSDSGIKDLRNLDALIARSPSFEFAFKVTKDPFLSPYWASDEWLSQLPQTKILTLDMDPCLDDCVMFAKKLKALGRPVSLDILKGLPHGFLNFTMLSNEAMEGSKYCIKCLQELFKLPEVA